ncbi:MAG: hypothetical protein KAH38_12715 [Candidatus Hydrogenedentes bacterium]|nr:hypothetical protein [Candidatus Hydrogenedentota bacterium]
MPEKNFTPAEITTIRAAVSKTFVALRKKGFIARMNFSCYMSCAVYELTQIARPRNKPRVVYYHHQDDSSFREGYPLHIRFFYLPPEDDESDSTELEKEIGEQVASALREQHLEIEWDGNPRYTIRIIGLKP